MTTKKNKTSKFKFNFKTLGIIFSTVAVMGITFGVLVMADVIHFGPQVVKTKPKDKKEKSVTVPERLTLTQKQEESFVKYLASKNDKQVTSVLNMTMEQTGKPTNLFYLTDDYRKIYINGNNDGKGLQAVSIIGQYTWDNNEKHGLMMGIGGEDTSIVGYKKPQNLSIYYEGYVGHIAGSNGFSSTIFIVANDGNIYKQDVQQNGNGMMWRPNADYKIMANDTGLTVSKVDDQSIIKKLNKIVGYDTKKIEPTTFDNAEALSDQEKYALVIMKSEPLAFGGAELTPRAFNDTNNPVTELKLMDGFHDGEKDGRQIIESNFGAAGGGGFNYNAVKISGDLVNIYNTPEILNPDAIVAEWRTGDGGIKETYSLSDVYKSMIINNADNRKVLYDISNIFFNTLDK